MNLWVDVRGVPAKRRLPYLKEARKVAARIVLGPDDPPRAEALVLDGDTFLDGTRVVARMVRLRSPADQESASRATGTIVAACEDWKVIPLENLVASRRDRPGNLFASTRDVDEARLFLNVLETGVDGILLAPRAPADIATVAQILRARRPPPAVPAPGPDPPAGPLAADDRAEGGAGAVGTTPLALHHATVLSVSDAGNGDRVCVDATSAFAADEGLLVGSTARSMCLVLAETPAAGWVRPRPFRVNAGALHAYVGGGSQTRYLSEAESGLALVAVRADGSCRPVVVGRAKIERRPHVLVHWEREGRPGSMMLQWAETVRLATPAGAVAVTDLRPGDAILVHESHAGRHMGMAVDAEVTER